MSERPAEATTPRSAGTDFIRQIVSADLKSGKGGTVFLGSVTAPAIDLAVPAIRRIRERHPRIEINIQVDASNVLARELLASRHDFIIARIPDDLDPRLVRADDRRAGPRPATGHRHLPAAHAPLQGR